MKAAARKDHLHSCLIPSHAAGPIVSGGAMTLTVGLASARLIDRAACTGADPIAQGSSSVLIEGLPASRKDDKCSHGGVITGGESSVLIGGPAVTIKVNGDEAFAIDVQNALAKLLKTRSGLEWLRQMAANGRTVTIERWDQKGARCDPDNPEDAKNGKGTDSTIFWNPDMDHHPNFTDRPGSEIVLAHEMVHALHDGNGANKNGPPDHYDGQEKGETSDRNEERSTVGTAGPVRLPKDKGWEGCPPDYSNDVPTENSFRDDLGKPRRPSYYPPGMRGGAPW